MKKYILFLLAGTTISASAQTTTEFKDWVTSLVMDSSGRFYAGTSSNGNGIFVSSDGGNTWRPTSMRYGVTSMTLTKSGAIVTFAFGYSYGRYLFRLSQGGGALDSVALSFTPTSIVASQNGALYALTFGQGIYKSTDDGTHWTQFAANTYPIANPSAIAATKENVVFVSSSYGVYRSTDSGTTWKKGNWGYHDSLLVSRLVLSGNGMMYCGGYEGMGAYAYEFFSSRDTGRTWTLTAALKTGLDALAVDSSGTMYVGNKNGVYRITASGDTSYRGPAGIAHNGYGARTLLALHADTLFAGGWGGVYKTTNAGTNWSVLHDGMLSSTDTSQFTSSLPFGYYISCGMVDTNGTFIVGTDSAGVFRSMDHGKTWMQSTLTLPLVTCIVSDSAGYIWASTLRSGVYKSLDGGTTWSTTDSPGNMALGRKINALAMQHLWYHLSFDSTRSMRTRILFAGTDEGIYEYYADLIAMSWLSTGSSTDPFTAMHPLTSSAIVAATNDGRVYICTTGWNYQGSVGQQVTTLVSNSADELFAIGSRGVFRSTDLGLTWMQKNTGITDTNLISAAVGKSGTLFVGSSGKGAIYRSSDRGDHWSLLASLSYPVRCLLLENGEENIYAATADRLFRSATTGVTFLIHPQLLPDEFALEQNYPNPFNPSTTIRYSLPTASRVKLVIYNMLGQSVCELVNDEQPPGVREIRWNANVASGVYFVQLTAATVNNPGRNFVETRKMVLLH
jgi:photosystem II stability/assembly factor-like uncharacterized protein